MLATIESATVIGVDACRVHVEIDVSRGFPHFQLVGLPDTSIKESRDRVRAAMLNSGFDFPPSRITINLAPGDVRKGGPTFDLPIAIGLLAARGEIKRDDFAGIVHVGELSLDGSIQPARGVLPIAAEARRNGAKALLLPHDNLAEASVVSGLRGSRYRSTAARKSGPGTGGRPQDGTTTKVMTPGADQHPSSIR